VDVRLTEAEVIALAYHRAARGDAWSALVTAVADALVDLGEAEQRLARQDRLISRGYARCWTGTGGSAVPSSDDNRPGPEQAS
jgi:hypothetical protein